MSTKSIREALTMLRVQAPPGTVLEKAVDDAEAEVEAIEKAARDMTRLGAGDMTYRIRDSERVMRETPDGSSTWHHHDVHAWSDASVTLRRIAEDAPPAKEVAPQPHGE